MASKPVAFLLADLGVTKSHSRTHTSNDNPFSEAQFETLKSPWLSRPIRVHQTGSGLLPRLFRLV